MPLASVSGVNVRLEISAVVMTWLAVMSVPFSCSVPAVGRLVMVMDARVSPSMSLKLKSVIVNVWLLSSLMVMVLSVAVGASLTGLTTTLMVSVSILKAVVPPFVLTSTFVPDVPKVWSQARNVKPLVMFPLKSAVGANNTRVLVLSAKSKALVSDTTPTGVLVVPPLVV